MGDFINQIKKVSGPRKHSVTNSYGVKDSFTYYKKHRPKDKEFVLSDTTFRSLVRMVNDLIVEEFITNGEFKLPLDMGSFKLYKKTNTPKIDSTGKLVYNAPIDWNQTLKLWESDNESKVAKTLVKITPGDIYSIKYKHSYCKFKNKGYYIFKPNRQLKNLLKEKIRSNQSIPHFTHYKQF